MCFCAFEYRISGINENEMPILKYLVHPQGKVIELNCDYLPQRDGSNLGALSSMTSLWAWNYGLAPFPFFAIGASVYF